MRNSLLATVAVAAVVGFTTLAVAQNSQKEGETGKAPIQPQGAQQPQKGAPGGATKPGATQTSPGKSTLGQSGGQADQGAHRDTKERLGQDRPAGEQNGKLGADEEHGKTGAKADEKRTGQSSTQTGGSRGASVQLSQDQRTKITAVIGKGHAAHVANNVKFNVTVGAMVPRDIHVEVLPTDIVEIVPQYEGFDYVVVGDEILIIDPDTMEIVAVIPA